MLGIVASMAIGYSLANEFYLGIIFVLGLLFFFLVASNEKRALMLIASLWAIYWLPGISASSIEALKNALILIYLSVSVVRAVIRRQKLMAFIFQTKASKFVGVLVFALLPGVFSGRDLSVSLPIWSRYVAALLIYASFRQTFHVYQGAALKIMKILALPVGISGTYVILAKLGILTPFPLPNSFRIESVLMGFSYRHSGLAWQIAFVAPIITACFLRNLRGGNIIWVLWGLLLGILLVVVALTENRGGAIASIISIFIVFQILARKKTQIFLFGVIVMLVFSMKSFFIKDVLLRGWNGNLLHNSRSIQLVADKISDGRIAIWQLSLHQFLGHPFVGIGLGKSGFSMLLHGMRATNVHNLYLGIASESGFFAAAVSLSFFLFLLVYYYRKIKESRALSQNYIIIASYAIIVVGFMNSIVEAGSMFNALYLGLPFWLALATIDDGIAN